MFLWYRFNVFIVASSVRTLHYVNFLLNNSGCNQKLILLKLSNIVKIKIENDLRYVDLAKRKEIILINPIEWWNLNWNEKLFGVAISKLVLMDALS